jgi:alpha-1,6-mannosyltransferase
MRERLRERVVLVLSASVITTCVVVWAVQGDQTERVPSFLAWFGLAFTAYLVALGRAADLSKRGLILALLVAGVWRAILVTAPPLLSDDVYRSVWEGRVQLRGGNPYAWGDRPDSPRWEPMRDEVWRAMNHRDYPAVYPPLWQLAARAVVATADSVTAMKAFLATVEMLALWPLATVLRRRGLPRGRLLVLAWSPLAIVEVAGSGHNEALGLLFLAVSLAALESGRPLLSAVAAALGFQTKLLPGLVAAAWARRYRAAHVVVAAVVAALLLWPYRSAGRVLFLSLSKYAALWRFNETAFAPLAALFGHAAAVRLGAFIVLALAFALAGRRAEPVTAATAVVAATLLLAPSVLPWYALWLLPLLVVRDEAAALLFTGTIALAYVVYPTWRSGEPWHVGWDVRALEYAPCLLVLALSRRRRQAVGAQEVDSNRALV